MLTIDCNGMTKEQIEQKVKECRSAQKKKNKLFRDNLRKKKLDDLFGTKDKIMFVKEDKKKEDKKTETLVEKKNEKTVTPGNT